MAKCIKCNSDKLIPHVRILDRANVGDRFSLEAEVDPYPQRFGIFKEIARSPLEATICGECGYTELTATNPGELYQAYLKARQLS